MRRTVATTAWEPPSACSVRTSNRANQRRRFRMNLQHVNVKLLAKDWEKINDQIDLEPLIPIFHSWIEGKIFEELLLDVADYRHVPEGPGVVLIGLQADYGGDKTVGRL